MFSIVKGISQKGKKKKARPHLNYRLNYIGTTFVRGAPVTLLSHEDVSVNDVCASKGGKNMTLRDDIIPPYQSISLYNSMQPDSSYYEVRAVRVDEKGKNKIIE